MLDVRRMRILREVAAQGSIVAAAQRLGYTPSAVSQHLAALERESGVALVERGPNSLRLTPAGRALVEHTQGILERLSAAEAEIRSLGAHERPALHLGAFSTASATLMAGAIQAFRRSHPDVGLSLLEGDPEDTVPRLRAGELDVVLTYEYDHVPLEEDPAIERVALLDDPIRLVVPAGHPVLRRPAVRLRDLEGEPFIDQPRVDCRNFTSLTCAADGFAVDISCFSSDYYATQALVAAGIGAALVPALALLEPHPRVGVVGLDSPAPQRRIFVTVRAGTQHPSVGAMVSTLRAVATALAPRIAATGRTVATA